MSAPMGPTWTIGHLFFKWPALGLICVCAATGYGYIPKNPDDSNRLLTITFDDGWKSSQLAIDEMLERKIPSTSYIIPTVLGTAPHITEEQMLLNFDAGVEIGAHTMTHKDLTKLETLEALYEMGESRDHLQEMTKSPVFSFASPYGETNEITRKIYTRLFDTYVNAYSEYSGINHRATFDPYNINRLDVYADLYSPEKMCDWIANISEDEWEFFFSTKSTKKKSLDTHTTSTTSNKF